MIVAIVAAAIFLLLLVFVASSVKIVQPYQRGVVERLGRYHATVDPGLGHRGQASFVVGKGTPGLRQGKKESKIGIRASHTAEVVLEDCRIPVENLLGGTEKLERKLERARSGESSGRASNALATFELTRPIVGASALGIAQAA